MSDNNIVVWVCGLGGALAIASLAVWLQHKRERDRLKQVVSQLQPILGTGASSAGVYDKSLPQWHCVWHDQPITFHYGFHHKAEMDYLHVFAPYQKQTPFFLSRTVPFRTKPEKLEEAVKLSLSQTSDASLAQRLRSALEDERFGEIRTASKKFHSRFVDLPTRDRSSKEPTSGKIEYLELTLKRPQREDRRDEKNDWSDEFMRSHLELLLQTKRSLEAGKI
ncbi:hypothetical protein [Desulfosarcina ovata]|uniref:Uncharacterized protein n=1 Tax=Desulfosarcina ovata subsp. ovata TaxID=2752305 RepID=A0A5K8AFY9_9BACT|nr:hypothetical protein [Desulfosarcina ovata]BBO91547.1 hypothetical protein DSCOOX_47270 [Desulfosarcina ovata subsp. ovata]